MRIDWPGINRNSGDWIMSVLSLVLLLAMGSCGSDSSGFPIGASNAVGDKKELTDTPTGKKVEILYKDGQFQFFRNGTPYYVKGGAGSSHLGLLRKAGGNSIRTYTTIGLDTILDQAQQNDLTVMVGIELGKPRYGFDYADEQAVLKQKEGVRQLIETYKAHPAILSWTIGNELLNKKEPKAIILLQALEDLTQMIHKLDPDHPVNTSIYGISEQIDQINRYCPSLDFIMINGFSALRNEGGDLRKKLEAYNKPYLISEWGTTGWWESRQTPWFAPVEPTMEEKEAQIQEIYRQFILPNKANCLGSYAFFWGQRQEATPTWFGFFLKSGEKTLLVETLSQLWEHPVEGNKAPVLGKIQLIGKEQVDPYLAAGEVNNFSVEAFDPEGDSLQFQWMVIPEGPVHHPEKYGVELPPPVVEGSFRETQENEVAIPVPWKSGPYRVMVYAYDKQGNGAYANLPFYSVNDSLTGQ